MALSKPKLNVCLLEDEDFFTALFRDILESLNCNVFAFSRLDHFAKTFENNLKTSKVDLFIVDRFFDMDGVDTLAVSFGWSIKDFFKEEQMVVLCSCVDIPKEAYTKAGFDLFFKKDGRTMRRKIHNVVEKIRTSLT